MIVSRVFLGIVLLSGQDDLWGSSWKRTSWPLGQSGGSVPDQMKEVLQRIFTAIRIHFRKILHSYSDIVFCRTALIFLFRTTETRRRYKTACFPSHATGAHQIGASCPEDCI